MKEHERCEKPDNAVYFVSRLNDVITQSSFHEHGFLSKPQCAGLTFHCSADILFAESGPLPPLSGVQSITRKGKASRLRDELKSNSTILAPLQTTTLPNPASTDSLGSLCHVTYMVHSCRCIVCGCCGRHVVEYKDWDAPFLHPENLQRNDDNNYGVIKQIYLLEKIKNWG